MNKSKDYWIEKKLVNPYAATNVSLFRFLGLLRLSLFFLENSCTGETLIFCPRFDFLGGWV